MKFLTFIVIAVPCIGWAQIGGQSGYQSLELTSNARTAALGGTTVSLRNDLSQFFENPAALDSVSSGSIFFNINPYFADVFVSSVGYTFDTKKSGPFALGMQYVNYGSFEMTDETGQSIGEFPVQDYQVLVGKSHRLGPFVLGANVKLTHSRIDIYQSTALMADIGGMFQVNKNWNVAMVFTNMGVKISDYTISDGSSIPFDVKIGTTFKPEHMPFRFSLTSTSLVDNNFAEQGESQGRSTTEIDQLLKRVNFGTELLLSENFQLLFGYSHKRKQELKLNNTGGGAGFSFGLIMRIKRLELRYSRTTYHAAGGTSFISLQTNLKDFKKIL